MSLQEYIKCVAAVGFMDEPDVFNPDESQMSWKETLQLSVMQIPFVVRLHFFYWVTPFLC